MAAAALRSRCLEAGAPFGRVQRLGVALADEQQLDEGDGVGEAGLQRRRAVLAQHLVRVLAAERQRELEAARRLQQRQRAVDGAEGRRAAGEVAVEAQRRLGVQPPERLHLLLGQRRAHRRHRRDAGALAGDHVHVAFDHDQRGASSEGRACSSLRASGRP